MFHVKHLLAGVACRSRRRQGIGCNRRRNGRIILTGSPWRICYKMCGTESHGAAQDKCQNQCDCHGTKPSGKSRDPLLRRWYAIPWCLFYGGRNLTPGKANRHILIHRIILHFLQAASAKGLPALYIASALHTVHSKPSSASVFCLAAGC